MKRTEIWKINGRDYKEMTRELLEACDLASLLPSDREALIGIKPNLVSSQPASNGGTTHPEVVAGLLEYLQKYGFSNLQIMEGSWLGDQTATAFQVCGYRELEKTYGVTLTDAQKEPFQELDCKGLKLKVCDCARKPAFLINVPVLKGHCQTHITCALKNLKGLIPNSEKRHFHSMGLHKPIAHLQTAIHQDFILVDHICGDLTFEDGGNPVTTNTLFAARDPVLMDSYVCRLLNYQPSDVDYILLAEQLGIGSTALEKAELCHVNRSVTASAHAAPRVVRSPLTDHCTPIETEHRIVALQDAVTEVESCSACYEYLISALNQLEKEGLLSSIGEKIRIGQGCRGESGILGVGQCTAGFQYSIKGCPPTEMQIYEGLKEWIRQRAGH